MIAGKTKLILGITGGIAAYKTVELVSRLKDENFDVFCILTENAKKFVSPFALEVISGNKVYDDDCLHTVSETRSFIDHIELTKQAELILLAPTTANSIGKIANGISGEILFDMLLANNKPVFVAPAMNSQMWESPIVQDNLNKIQSKLKYHIIAPDSGQLACNTIGIGRLTDITTLVNTLSSFIHKNPPKNNQLPLKDKKIFVTAGGSKEYIDPVRYISNSSSGEMGYALCVEALELGAKVSLYTSINFLKDIDKANTLKNFISTSQLEIIYYDTADSLYQSLKNNISNADSLIMAAAIADFKPSQTAPSKLKKAELLKIDSEPSITLEENIDILKTLSSQKQTKQIFIGFALETDNLLKNAKSKLHTKNLDYIIANSAAALNNIESQIMIIAKNGSTKKYIQQEKRLSAKAIILECLVNNN